MESRQVVAPGVQVRILSFPNVDALAVLMWVRFFIGRIREREAPVEAAIYWRYGGTGID